MTHKLAEIRQGRTSIAVQQGQTILDAALKAGIPYPHGCKSGRCGSCKSRLIEGEVDLLAHSRFALSEEEKTAGLILACRAMPRTDTVVAWLGGDDDAVPAVAGPPAMVDAAKEAAFARGLRKEDMDANVFFTVALSDAGGRSP